MPEWLQSIAGPDYAAAVLWTIGALILLVVVLVIIRLIRSMTFGTFVAGGRNRKTRLAVMDATAVDSHRRLVLVRRDDVEHLILIGGPTDVVVEQNIRLGQTRRPALTGEAVQQDSAPRPQRPGEQSRPAEPQRMQQAQQRIPVPPLREQRPQPRPPEREAAPQQPQRAAQPQPAPQPAVQPQRMAQPMRTNPSAPPPAGRDDHLPRDLQGSAPPRANPADDIDRALLDELSSSLDDEPQPSGKAGPVSLEDEMNKLLGELSNGKR
ncbi:hypothetical protein MesoLjLc_43620 [Mesorhizobium sp. L-8-10]|uniref:flagellar biosynthetic protein FliO n=1 Tax=unclassified Mesorhizobium TaxID=325217 RepID=UPI001928BF2D|nr:MULTISPECIES: flagellar biosynthetic protein FliO [unclassified Mesorhizobium]BCH24696.1 hypothetical protein MesoLjLb_44810 [Mesorhizobium sp. L-8-3]BCH32432.1 hypothetical protein MesoLjLc_43620 [Mesorhizobium sp. L-8-10]